MQKPLWPHFNSEIRQKEVTDFFSKLAPDYDRIQPFSYWQFTDSVLESLLQQLVFSQQNPAQKLQILDAGAGTGKWSQKIQKAFPYSSITLLDISKEMLEIAKNKFNNSNFQFVEDNIDNMSYLPHQNFDLTFCLYNVLGFNSTPVEALRNLTNVTKATGTLSLVIPNYYYALQFSAHNHRYSEIQRITQNYNVKYTDHNPEILLFTPQLINQILTELGWTNIQTLGFPISIYSENKGDQIITLNQDNDQISWQELIDIEVEQCLKPEAASRGKNLLVIATKI